MKQYPDSIVLSVNSPATQDSTGSWVAGYSTNYTFDCRAEVNSSGRRIVGADGVLLDYTMICYASLDGLADVVMTYTTGEVATTELGEPIVIGSLISSLQYGTEATYSLTNRLGEIYTGTVKRSFCGQLNSRLWL